LYAVRLWFNTPAAQTVAVPAAGWGWPQGSSYGSGADGVFVACAASTSVNKSSTGRSRKTTTDFSAALAAAHRAAAFTGLGLAVTVIGMLLILLFSWWQARGRDTTYVYGLLCLCQLLSDCRIFPICASRHGRKQAGKGLAETIANYRGDRLGLYQFYSTSSVFYNGDIAMKLEPSGALSCTSPSVRLGK